jgi:hypothetical protein
VRRLEFWYTWWIGRFVLYRKGASLDVWEASTEYRRLHKAAANEKVDACEQASGGKEERM